MNMIKLPVIVGLGGINAAGRTSGFHSYKRMICDVLSADELSNTWQDLAHRMGLPVGSSMSLDMIETIKKGTLVRKIELFDPEQVRCHHKARLDSSSFIIKKSKLSDYSALVLG